MSRPKEFSRDDVLENALNQFWATGYAATGLRDLEKATSVNKSGLYSEFKNKEDLFLCSLRRYFDNRPARQILKREPFGWENIETYLKTVCPTPEGQRGCFAVNTLRELETLPAEAQKLIRENRAKLKKLFAQNIPSASRLSAVAASELILSFYYGLQAEQNIESNKMSFHRRIGDFLSLLRD